MIDKFEVVNVDLIDIVMVYAEEYKQVSYLIVDYDVMFTYQ